MFIELNFTTDQTLSTVFRLANEIINQSSITSASTLNTYLNTNAPGNFPGLDVANSLVIKTVVPTTTKSHYTKGTNQTSGSYNGFLRWTVEFQAYDSTRKYYVQQRHQEVNAPGGSTTVLGTSLTGGDMSSSQQPIGEGANGISGTYLTVAGTTETGMLNNIGSTTNGGTNIRTFWLHLSNTGMIFAMTNSTSSALGFNNTYTNNTAFTGPFIFGQYTRHDYFNTDANTIFPMMYTNLDRGIFGMGFGGSTGDWTSVHNSMATYPGITTTHPFKVVNLISAAQQTGSTWPVVNFPVVNWGVGNRFDEQFGLTATTNPGTATVGTQNWAPGIFTTANTRYPSADLKSVGFAMLPITWRHTYYNNTGGNMSERSGYYLFNGEYYPGDQFTYGGKTYIIFPTYTGYTARVGIAVPME